MRPFELHRPPALPDALALLGELGEEARPYAGGTELLLVMKQGLARYGHLVDLKRLPGLTTIDFDAASGQLRLGALCRHRDVELSPVVRAAWPLLAAAEAEVANVRVRNTGSIGGNLCFAEPHSDIATLFRLAGCRVTLTGPQGDRELDLAEFLVGAYETALAPGELLTQVVLGPLKPDTRYGYRRFRFHERPSLNVGVALVGAERVVAARVVVGACESVPRRLAAAEAVLVGVPLAELPAAAEGLKAAVCAAVQPLEDASGSPAYKQELAGVLAVRALADALQGGASR